MPTPGSEPQVGSDWPMPRIYVVIVVLLPRASWIARFGTLPARSLRFCTFCVSSVAADSAVTAIGTSCSNSARRRAVTVMVSIDVSCSFFFAASSFLAAAPGASAAAPAAALERRRHAPPRWRTRQRQWRFSGACRSLWALQELMRVRMRRCAMQIDFYLFVNKLPVCFLTRKPQCSNAIRIQIWLDSAAARRVARMPAMHHSTRRGSIAA